MCWDRKDQEEAGSTARWAQLANTLVSGPTWQPADPPDPEELVEETETGDGDLVATHQLNLPGLVHSPNVGHSESHETDWKRSDWQTLEMG